ncbi:hypothetical protein DKT77_15105 [Meridianimarinicoccus roseus]|uniref:Gamma-glutamylcyclotransferase AIG2-like domain-containing protein n=1 Tax=Meridianimarinicoccus roseus TaxID=2072018 RepID=A0A2V2LJ92_9RHOB|nr:gamma-glutamylcyclotransferase family protein [Meridianimarinicoccus roseus]PWR01913.1 hypothetical protein DKT77_15105 [Meridianimarinicoccus roseus]
MVLGHVALYGSLRRAVFSPAAPSLDGLARHVGDCTLWGRLVDHGPYPGFFLTGPDDGGPVVADLAEILHPGFFAVFDALEGFEEDDPDGSLYLRQRTVLVAPRMEVWVYVSNHRPDDPEIVHGDWARHVGGRAPW